MAKETIKQLASFAVISVNGGQRVTFTYDEINPDTGDVISQNNKGNFYAVDQTLLKNIDDIKSYIVEHKLSE